MTGVEERKKKKEKQQMIKVQHQHSKSANGVHELFLKGTFHDITGVIPNWYFQLVCKIGMQNVIS